MSMVMTVSQGSVVGSMIMTFMDETARGGRKNDNLIGV